MTTSEGDTVRAIFDAASEPARQLINEIIKIEKEKLYMSKPTGMAEAILSAVKDIVK